MRALLVNPWIYDFAAYDLWSKPLGLLNIASRLKNSGCELSLVDCLDRFHPALRKFLKGKLPRAASSGSGFYYSEEIEKPAIFKDIPRKFKRYGIPKKIFEQIIYKEPKPDIILVASGMTYWYPAYIDAIKILKQRFPDTPLVLGGVYTNLCFEHAKNCSGADHIYKGNDIHEILELIGRLADAGFDYSPIRKARSLSHAYELYDEFNYVTLRTSSGCPFKCSYCGWYLLEEGIKQQNPDFILDEIGYFYKKHHVRNFAFYDEALLYNAENHIFKILKGLIDRKIKANFHTPNGLHNKFITPELARLLNMAGFVKPRLSLETSCVKRQIKTGGKTTNEEFLQAVTYLKNGGYATSDIGVYLLIGLPAQSAKEVEKSIKFAASQKVRIHLEEYSPIPDTPDYAKSGLPPDADPLLHNNSAFPLYRPDEYPVFQKIKDIVHRLND